MGLEPSGGVGLGDCELRVLDRHRTRGHVVCFAIRCFSMGKPTGFMEFEREAVPYRDPLERISDYAEINTNPSEEHLQTQGARCMDCGVLLKPSSAATDAPRL